MCFVYLLTFLHSYIHYDQYIHPIGSNWPLWAAGESFILLKLQRLAENLLHSGPPESGLLTNTDYNGFDPLTADI